MSKDVTARPKAEPISDAAKSYGRTITRIQVASAVWNLWDRIRRDQGLDQQWLADRMGKDKSWASKLLKGPGNWTLDTVGEVLEAMGGRLTLVEANTYEEIAQGQVAEGSRQSSSRLIIKIEAEITIDDPDRLDFNEMNWNLQGGSGGLHQLARGLDSQVKSS